MSINFNVTMITSKNLDLKKLNEATKNAKREPNNKPLPIVVTETQHARFRMLQDRFKGRGDLDIDMQDIMRKTLDIAMDRAEKLLDQT